MPISAASVFRAVRPRRSTACARCIAAHLRAIPYENLDVQLGRPVTIGRDAVLDKVIGRGRGGWCYEMNGVLGWALEQLGFKITRLAGGGDARGRWAMRRSAITWC